jgi:hypothetical protein
MLMRQGKSTNPEERAIACKMLRQLKTLCHQYPHGFISMGAIGQLPSIICGIWLTAQIVALPGMVLAMD